MTILFYTANVVNPKIMAAVVADLKSFGYPIVCVSQEPMDFEVNIVVPKHRSVQNIYRQVLIAAKEATSDYVALCEDDSFYTPEHFLYRPRHFGYNLNRWLLHIREEIFSYRGRPVLSQCIANRQSLVDTLTERLALPVLPDHQCGEMGRLEHTLGIKHYGFETFRTALPNLVVCHDRGTLGHKRPGTDRATFVPAFGSASDWLERFK